MLMLNISLLMKLIKLFHSLIVKILDGRLMFANSRSIMLSMESIVKNKTLKILRKRKQNLKKIKKLKNSDLKVAKSLMLL